ncbi:hypothetical protein, partial [Streptomyces europaeiscabiei]|uniref:hypothetical protein n=1 Tax=Streptomyces europaeiscabiei TaxID=146819 RepID=UPI0029BA9C32
NTTGQTAIHLEFRWPSAWTRLAAHLDFATAAVNRRILERLMCRRSVLMSEALSKATAAGLLNVFLDSSTPCRSESRQPPLSHRVSKRTVQESCRINCILR